ncbi:hypothetical protein [Streptomyces sp. NBC_01750]|uniref:hypothetical protein n=1 Tax=Streptomyces sp. NBC_01750 TaxID=2975928 RepID=UPI002DDACEBE|nr:hypothetical protein [Streptomyces sp. NBC_01750]WSD30626.1 hypothetical protein OG966_00690 [Streptomyces sp. NBC_01750]
MIRVTDGTAIPARIIAVDASGHTVAVYTAQVPIAKKTRNVILDKSFGAPAITKDGGSTNL